MTLRNRVEYLEKSTVGEREPIDIFVVFVSPGALDAPIHRITSKSNDQEWMRRDGETEDQLKHRAETEAIVPPGHTARWFLCYPEGMR